MANVDLRNSYLYTPNYIHHNIITNPVKKNKDTRKVERTTPTFKSFLQKNMDNRK